MARRRRDALSGSRLVRMPLALPVAGALLLVGITGCTASADGSPSSSPKASPSVTATLLPPCANPDGGVCIGALAAGKGYTTAAFSPVITYTVPTAGWMNDEDLPGNFLLVPPGNTLAGVDAGTSDFIGAYASIAPSQFAELPSCSVVPVDGVAATPAAFAAWLGRLKNVSATSPVTVTVGGLHGVRVDLRVKSENALPRCTDDDTGTKIRYQPIFLGLNQSALDHGLGPPGLVMRLYLMASENGVLGIEVDDIPKAPGTLAALSAIAEQWRFSTSN